MTLGDDTGWPHRGSTWPAQPLLRTTATINMAAANFVVITNREGCTARLLEQPISTNSMPCAFFPGVVIDCRLLLKIDRNLEGPLSVATWDDMAWIGGTASGTLYRSMVSPVRNKQCCIHYYYVENVVIRLAWLHYVNATAALHTVRVINVSLTLTLMLMWKLSTVMCQWWCNAIKNINNTLVHWPLHSLLGIHCLLTGQV